MPEEIDMFKIFHIIKEKLWSIIFITLISIVVSGLASYFLLDKVYEASTTMIVSKAKEKGTVVLQYNDVLLNQELVKTYSEIAKSDRVLDLVIDKLSLGVTAKDLRDKIKIESVKETELIKISVLDLDPKFATDLANAIAVVFMGEVADIMNMDNVQIIDYAKVPVEPVKPSPIVNMAIAGALGLIFSLGSIVIIQHLDNTVKNPQDIENQIGLPVLGNIPYFGECYLAGK